jgi:hypothetical protein
MSITDGWATDEKTGKFYVNGVLVDAVGAGLNGSATIPSGGTSIACTHGLGSTPKVFFSPKTNLAGRSVWISGHSNSGFTINISSSAGSGGILFDYVVKP